METQTTQTTQIMQTTKHINDRPDSVEIGSPSKGGTIKIYFNTDDAKEKTESRIVAAFEARKFANEQLEKQNKGE